jgi:glutathione S-transferase
VTYVLYELCAADGRAFSPFCWRARMALAHKGIEPQLHKVRFTDIAGLGLDCRTVPVLVDGATVVRDSWDIACHLDEKLPDAPPLFACEGDRRLAQFVSHWVVAQLHMPIFKTIAADIWDAVDAADRPYFRASREKRLGGAPLESVRDDQPATIAHFRSNLAPLRALLGGQAFVGGSRPTYADYVAFGALQWARVIGAPRMLEDGDAVQEWFERCLDLHDGTGRAETPANERQRLSGLSAS